MAGNAMEPSQLFRDASTARNEFFSKLKPCCVEISKLAMTSTTNVAQRAPRLNELLEQLFSLFNIQVAYNPSVIDVKLAEYTFFPLSFIFKSQEQWPGRTIELALSCLRILIQYGWKETINASLIQQLLILLTFIVGDVPTQGPKRDFPEETTLEGYRALGALVKASRPSQALTAAKIIPALGHTVSVVLDGVTDGKTPAIELEALEVLTALSATIKDQEALASFLPGIVSSLTKTLSPPLSKTNQKRVIVKALQTLQVTLISVLSDVKVRNILKKVEDGIFEESDSSKLLSPAWLKATSSQIKIALSTILKLRGQRSGDVQKVLERFCIALLDECHASLAESQSILVETAIILQPAEDDTTLPQADTFREGLGFNTSLQDLARIFPEIGETIKLTLYNWVTSLPRVMQSSDEDVKQLAIQSLVKGNELVAKLQIDSSTLDDSLSSALRDSMVALVLSSKPTKILDEVGPDEHLWANKGSQISDVVSYDPVLLVQEGQKKTRLDMIQLVSKTGTPSQQTNLAAEMLSFVRDSEGVDQVSSYWLAFELLKASYARKSDLEDFLDLPSDKGDTDQESVLHELFAFSVIVLASHSDLDGVDWGVAAISLEVAAFAAAQLQSSFRPELIDVLYPVSTFLGSQNPQLRGHAIHTLNIIASSCGYPNVSDLIIDNADYMVNSVALRLNTFDISPASTKVLIMLIRLTGPKLIPYLDDVVAAIFAALENFHGNQVFVEGLFSVLSEVVKQGVRSDVLLIGDEQSKAVDHRKTIPTATNTEMLLSRLDKRAAKKQLEGDNIGIEEIQRDNHPRTPWGPGQGDPRHGDDHDLDQEERSSSEMEKATPPATATYSLLTRVATLTQYYLTSPTPTLRKSLLDLLAMVGPALAPNEEAYLPLVNAVWPVVICRLYDSEPFVVVSACKTLSALCESAGDFLSSRIKVEWWDGLRKWCQKAKIDANNAAGKTRRKAGETLGTGAKGVSVPASGTRIEDQGILIPIRSLGGDTSGRLVEQSRTTGLGKHAQASRVWGAVTELLTAIVSFVRLDEEIFDQILELLVDGSSQNPEARAALDAINSDAVWLALYQKDAVQWIPTPILEPFRFAQIEEIRNPKLTWGDARGA